MFDHRLGAALNRTWLLGIFQSTKMMVSHDSVTQWLDRPFFSQHAENACCPASRSKLCPGIRWWYLVFVSSPHGVYQAPPKKPCGLEGGEGRAMERCSVTDCERISTFLSANAECVQLSGHLGNLGNCFYCWNAFVWSFRNFKSVLSATLVCCTGPRGLEAPSLLRAFVTQEQMVLSMWRGRWQQTKKISLRPSV